MTDERVREVGRWPDWQPIETAPKDGRWICLYRDWPAVGSWDTFVIARWIRFPDYSDFIWPDGSHFVDRFVPSSDDDEWILDGDFYEGQGKFTHWLPLPAMPAPLPSDGGGE